jgi:uncharacterized protein YdhG (YjbR/CyaY superfamily)
MASIDIFESFQRYQGTHHYKLLFHIFMSKLKVEDYIINLPDMQRITLTKLRTLIKSIVPDAEEVISYGMPTFKYHGILVCYAAFKNHLSFFPGNGQLIDELKEELEGFETSKGTIKFTPTKTIPIALIRKIVRTRIRENLANSKAK